MGNYASVLGNDPPNLLYLILQFSSNSTHLLLPYLSKSFRILYKSEQIQAILTHALVNEYHIYAPSSLPHKYTWRKLFRELYFLRHIWLAPELLQASQHTYKINVYSRFKPLSKEAEKVVDTLAASSTEDEVVDEAGNENHTRKIVLPLHQRLAVIKYANRLSSNRDALRVLMNEGSWFGGAGRATSLSSATARAQACPSPAPLVAGVHSVDPSAGKVVALTTDVGLREFLFDGVFATTASQSLVYATVAGGAIVDVINGFNATLLVYGQTGSGKTHTMFGATEESVYRQSALGAGIVPRAMAEILAATRSRSLFVTQLFLSYVEVFGDQVTDLLRGGVRCGHSKVAAQRYVLSGAAELAVHSLKDASLLMQQGDKQKRRAATAMNERSSRAHSLIIIKVAQTHIAQGTRIASSLFLVDLGGSEQVRKSGIDAGNQTTNGEFSTGFVKGTNMREAVNINLGLLALKKCIDALNTDSQYIPYQDSKLTMLLSEGLGGNSKASVIVCASMDVSHVTETVSALRFGEKCARIEKGVGSQWSLTDGVLKKLDEEISVLEGLIRAREKWVTIERTREDLVNGLVKREVLQETVLRGAEAERKALEGLLRRRYELTGRSLENILNAANVTGFGKSSEVYGIGKQFNPEADSMVDNERFGASTAAGKVPRAVAARGETWLSGVELEADTKAVEEQADKGKRSKLVYAGLSA